MRKPIVRIADQRDAENILRWGEKHIGNAEAFLYPSALVLASQNGKDLQYVLIHSVCLIEGLAPNPEAKPGELALGLRELMQSIRDITKASGMSEVIALLGPNDEKLEALAKRHGWEVLPYRVMRLRV